MDGPIPGNVSSSACVAEFMFIFSFLLVVLLLFFVFPELFVFPVFFSVLLALFSVPPVFFVTYTVVLSMLFSVVSLLLCFVSSFVGMVMVLHSLH